MPWLDNSLAVGCNISAVPVTIGSTWLNLTLEALETAHHRTHGPHGAWSRWLPESTTPLQNMKGSTLLTLDQQGQRAQPPKGPTGAFAPRHLQPFTHGRWNGWPVHCMLQADWSGRAGAFPVHEKMSCLQSCCEI